MGTTGATQPSAAGWSGGFLVAFSAGTDVHYERFAADGSSMGAPALAADGADASGTQDRPAVAVLPGGEAIVVFRDDTRGVRARVLDAAGAPVGGVIDIAPAGAGDPAVAAARDRFAVAWTELGAVRARLLAIDGSFALNREIPPSTAEFTVATGMVTVPTAAAGDDMFIVAWQEQSADGGDVRGRLFPLP
jgi:hypothetical protein